MAFDRGRGRKYSLANGSGAFIWKKTLNLVMAELEKRGDIADWVEWNFSNAGDG